MAELIKGQTIGKTWHAALSFLAATQREGFDLLAEVSTPHAEDADRGYIAALDRLLTRRGWQDTATVANTIFPAELARTSGSRERLYARYGSLLSRLRRASRKNNRGTYFERLIRYPLQSDHDRANQLETTIQTLVAEYARGGLRHAYPLQLSCPGLDVRPIGFPCLSSISLHVEGTQLRLVAIYRNQYYIQKALGNFIGLASLQKFVAGEAGLEPGALSVYAAHAQIDPKVGKRELAMLLRSLDTLQLDTLQQEQSDGPA